MNSLQAPSLQSLMDSDRGSNDSLLAESLQLDLDEVKFKKKMHYSAARVLLIGLFLYIVVFLYGSWTMPNTPFHMLI